MNIIRAFLLLFTVVFSVRALDSFDEINNEIIIKAQTHQDTDERPEIEDAQLPNLIDEDLGLTREDDFEDENIPAEEEIQEIVHQDIIYTNSSAIIFTTESFTAHQIGQNRTLNKPYLILFYDSQCQDCKNYSSIWDHLARAQIHTTIGVVDVSVNQELKDKFSIKILPTILYLQNIYQYEYQGERTFAEINLFIRSNFKFFQPTRISHEESFILDLKTFLATPSNMVSVGFLTIILTFLFILFSKNLQNKKTQSKIRRFNKQVQKSTKNVESKNKLF